MQSISRHPEREDKKRDRLTPLLIRCPKCQKKATTRRGTCEFCGVHLFIACRDCGHRNERSRRRCTGCGRCLHKSWIQKALTRRLGKATRITPLQVVLLIVAVAIGYKAVIYFVEALSHSSADRESASLQTGQGVLVTL
jgi:hypothetical protein